MARGSSNQPPIKKDADKISVKGRVSKSSGNNSSDDREAISDLDDEQMRAWIYFLKAYKVVVEDVDRDLRDATGVTLAEMEIIFAVKASGGRLRFIELSRNTLLSQSRISRLVDGLQSKGLIEREITAKDRRATYAILTEKGQEVWNRAQDPFAQALRAHFFDLVPPAQLKPLTRVLGVLLRDPGFYERNQQILMQAREFNRGAC